MAAAGVSPSCPRCGYDLSGLASSWQDACPLDGQCSECGLDVRWAEVLNPALTVPRWSFEHAPPQALRSRARMTWQHALYPPSFWRAVRLEHPVHRRRLWGYLMVMLLAAHLVAWGASTSCGYYMYWSRPAWAAAPAHPLVDAALQGAWPYRPPRLPGAVSADWYIGDARLFGWGELFGFLWLATTPACFLVLGESLRRVQVRRIHLFRALAYSFTAVPLFAAASLGLKSWVVVAVWRRGWFGSGFGWLGNLGEQGPRIVMLMFAAWMVVYWTVIPRRYLRLPHAGGVTAAMLILSALASAVMCTLLLLVVSGA